MARTSLTLFPWQDRIFHAFANAELKGCFRGNLDCFPRCRVSSFSRFPFGLHKLAEAGKYEFTIGLNFAGSQVVEFIKKLFYLRTFHSRLFGEMVEDFRLSHALSACRGFGRHSLV